jgi:dihydrofolate reductase
MTRKVVLQMHTTLDGLADSKTGFVPINDRPYWKELGRALEVTGASDVDTLLLGKGTYRQFASFWPKVATDPAAPKDWRAQAKFLHETPKVIFSKTLSAANWNNSTIVRGDVAREIARLKHRPGKNMLVPGGVAFPRALIERDLVDDRGPEWKSSLRTLAAAAKPAPRSVVDLSQWRDTPSTASFEVEAEPVRRALGISCNAACSEWVESPEGYGRVGP